MYLVFLQSLVRIIVSICFQNQPKTIRKKKIIVFYKNIILPEGGSHEIIKKSDRKDSK